MRVCVDAREEVGNSSPVKKQERHPKIGLLTRLQCKKQRFVQSSSSSTFSGKVADEREEVCRWWLLRGGVCEGTGDSGIGSMPS